MAKPEPVRLLHHFACTGGTLISKCIASMPNTLVLSEVEPHSQLVVSESRFFPTDLIRLARAGSRGSNVALDSAIFLGGLEAIHAHCRSCGLRLVLRDHAHSRYCAGPGVPDTPSLREVTRSKYRTLSVVTVRHPLDSFLSLVGNKWIHFEPGTIEEYARRYHRFLDDHADLPLFRYEDFLQEPEDTAERICEELALPFTPDFVDTFAAHALSGDSGRSSPVIGGRARQPVPDDLKSEKASSVAYRSLCDRLGYDQ